MADRQATDDFHALIDAAVDARVNALQLPPGPTLSAALEQNEIVNTALFGRKLRESEKVIRDDGAERAREQGMVQRLEGIETDVKEIRERLDGGVLLRFGWKEWGGLGTAITILGMILLRLLGVEVPG